MSKQQHFKHLGLRLAVKKHITYVKQLKHSLQPKAIINTHGNF